MVDDAGTGGQQAGGTGGDAGGAAPKGTPTADGTGGKASMMTETKTEGDKGTGGDSGGSKKLDMETLLGKDLAGDHNISKFLKSENPVQELAKSLIEAQKQVGKPKIGIPGEQATPEEKAAFYKEMGVPDNEDGYEFKKPEGMPDEAYNADHAKKWAGLMKQHNVPKAAANALRDELIKEGVAEATKATEELNTQLSTAFGDKKDVVSKEVGDLMKKAIPDAKLREKIEKGVSDKNTPAFALALGHVLQYMKKTYGLTDINTGGDGEGATGKSIPEMRAEAQKLMATPQYRDAMHKDHKETKEKVNKMYKDIGLLTNQQKKK